MTEFSSEFEKQFSGTMEHGLSTTDYAMAMILDNYAARQLDPGRFMTLKTGDASAGNGFIDRYADEDTGIYGYMCLVPGALVHEKTFFVSLYFTKQDLSFTGLVRDSNKTEPALLDIQQIDAWNKRIFKETVWSAQPPSGGWSNEFYQPQIRVISRFLTGDSPKNA